MAASSVIQPGGPYAALKPQAGDTCRGNCKWLPPAMQFRTHVAYLWCVILMLTFFLKVKLIFFTSNIRDFRLRSSEMLRSVDFYLDTDVSG
jgi:hypothetical protein